MTHLETQPYCPASAKLHIGAWIHDLRIGGAELPDATKLQLVRQLVAASPVRSHDGAFELVLPALSSLGVGIFRRTFRLDGIELRVVPYGSS